MSDTKVDETTDRYGRPLGPDPEALRVETDPVGVHIIRMQRPDEYRWAKERGHGVQWFDRHTWKSPEVLHVPLRGGDRWFVGYLDDQAIVNQGEGMPRIQGRSLYTYADSSCIAAHPEMGTAADIKRWKALQQWHEARVGDLVILRCYDLDGTLVETVAARLVLEGYGKTHLGLELVQR